jgi:hypothetical protein
MATNKNRKNNPDQYTDNCPGQNKNQAPQSKNKKNTPDMTNKNPNNFR